MRFDQSFAQLLTRLAGLTGVMAAVIGLVLMNVYDEEIGLIVTLTGAALAGLAVMVELATLLRVALSNRGAVGTNVLLQVLLAIAILVGVNVYSFYNYQRFDWTENQEFTLDAKLREQLATLKGETTIVVLQRHAAFGQQNRQDNYDSAADRKIIEKVRDLVEQFQQIGAQFRVRYLDIDDEKFEDHLAALAKESKALRKAIEDTPENSIFFFTKASAAIGQSQESIQRLSFADIYQLDREASQQANSKRGNLVLKYQGAGPFARKLLNIEEKRPRIAVAAAASSDTLTSPPPYGMRGAKKALDAHGYDTRDIVLKEGGACVLTFEESRMETLEGDLHRLTKYVRYLTELLDSAADFQQAVVKIEKSDFDEKVVDDAVRSLNMKYAVATREQVLPNGLVRLVADVRLRKNLEPDEVRRDLRPLEVLAQNDFLTKRREQHVLERERAEERRDKFTRELKSLNVEDLTEKRRIADLKTKLERMLADCDLLLVPRLTLISPHERNYDYGLYALDKAQVEAIKSFLKAGKPALFCFSPPQNEGDGTNEELDKVLYQLGVRLGRDTVYYEVDSDAVEARRTNPQSRAGEEPPPVQVNWSKNKGLLPRQHTFASGLSHPLRTSLHLSARVSSKQPLDLRLRFPQPVYAVKIPPNAPTTVAAVIGLCASGTILPLAGAHKSIERIDDQAIFLLSGDDSWNEDNPLPGPGDPVPTFRRSADDPNVGTIRERRRGPFPIAVALETQVPATWFDSKDARRPNVRVAVIGHGGVFVGASLSAAQERLLLSTCNWLLGRHDLIARDQETWEFPRVELDPWEQDLWSWGTMLVMPLTFGFFGMAVLLVRRMR